MPSPPASNHRATPAAKTAITVANSRADTTAHGDTSSKDTASKDAARHLAVAGQQTHSWGPQSAAEECLAATLTTRWMLITGRRLGQRPHLHDLTPDQLIDFWADDHLGPVPITTS